MPSLGIEPVFMQEMFQPAALPIHMLRNATVEEESTIIPLGLTDETIRPYHEVEDSQVNCRDTR